MGEKKAGVDDDSLPPNTIPREILEKDYGGNERKRELEMKLYMDPTPKKQKVEEEIMSSGGLRPGSTSASSDGEESSGIGDGSSEEARQKIEEQLRLLPEMKPQQQQVEHKIQSIQKPKQQGTTLSRSAK